MRASLVLNAEGGSGKTTVATNLAGYYAAEGAKVNCPVSKALTGTKITLDAGLA